MWRIINCPIKSDLLYTSLPESNLRCLGLYKKNKRKLGCFRSFNSLLKIEGNENVKFLDDEVIK